MRIQRATFHLGFTLVELLIVVAIIAIVSAIALPSMAEAVVRSKIARTTVDMRTVAHALEHYTVDFNRYPAPSPNGIDAPYWPPEMINPFDTWLSTQLTTPIAFLSPPVRDMFAKDPGPRSNLHYLLRENVRRLGGDLEDYDDWAMFVSGTNASSVRYMLISNGPDGDYEPIWVADWLEGDDIGDDPGDDGDDHDAEDAEELGMILYDPTNGTMSSGDVISWNR